MKVSDITTPAFRQLQDETGIRWPEPILLLYYNLSLNEIINLKPEAYVETRVVSLFPGIRQVPPVRTVSVIDVGWNMGQSGTDRGRAITSINKEQMDALLPGWATFPPDGEVLYAVIDDRNPNIFYVFPPQPVPDVNIMDGGTAAGLPTGVDGGGAGNIIEGGDSRGTGLRRVELLISIVPNEAVAITEDFALDESYRHTCIDYIIGRALLEETTIPNAQAKGQFFMQKFMQGLGIKSSVEKKISQEGQ